MLRVGHVALRVADLESSIAHAETMLGLRVSERHGDVAYLTCNRRHHELVLADGEAVACERLSLEQTAPEEYAALVDRIEGSGLPIVDRGPLTPGIEDAIRFVAPGGFVVEVFHGMAHDQPPSYDSVAPRPRKFEHITVKSTRKDELEQTLTDVVGLRLSDRAEDAISWMRASDEHHGVSVIAAEVDALHHYAWQYDGFATFARIGDHLMEHGRSFLWGPGHHGIGDNYFCYGFDADGVIVEHSAAMQRIEDEERYQPRIWPDVPLSVNRWGNPPPPPEFVQAATPLATLAGLAGRP
jgi:catechol 2,3-dioxygenase-like lactoylglutathione lyase family enzyme